MSISFFQDILSNLSNRGKALIDFSFSGSHESLEDLCLALLSSRGEASGVAMAQQILDRYETLEEEEKGTFFTFLAKKIQPSSRQISEAASAYLFHPGAESLDRLARAVESPQQEFFRRLNLAPGATAKIVSMRADLFPYIRDDSDLKRLDRDLQHLLTSWFNRGFLVLHLIDWNTPASILEKIIAYEAVHQIKGWDDLRRRLDPKDRRCFGYFHPSLFDEPLIFVEVALTDQIPGSIQNLLEQKSEDSDSKNINTAVFYSISNCQPGLRGISFGHFLIKQVASDLHNENPSLKTFVTLSPLPGFRKWLDQNYKDDDQRLDKSQRSSLQTLRADAGLKHDILPSEETDILNLAVEYLINAKNRKHRPLDPVARFHLGNGARLEQVHIRGDQSENGWRQSYGIMVNYLYDLTEIEKNHEAFVNDGTIAISKGLRSRARQLEKEQRGDGSRAMIAKPREIEAETED